jgi:hypothetical protein
MEAVVKVVLYQIKTVVTMLNQVQLHQRWKVGRVMWVDGASLRVRIRELVMMCVAS